jgi:tetratricopeptide (TPR) repeat protein
MSSITGPILAIMVVPYFGWGLYTMHRRYLRHHDWPVHVEIMSLTALVVYFALALPVLRGYLADTPAALAFALLGLTVSGFALYGHMAVSLTAKLVVDSVTVSGDPGSNAPRLGAGEALERQRDYEGAYAEYLMQSRMYPHDAQVKLRLAGVLKQLDRPAEAADWFAKVLDKSESREQCSIAAVRLSEIASRDLDDLPRGKQALERYLHQFPSAPDRSMIEDRLANLGRAHTEAQPGSGLVALDAEPFDVLQRDEPEEALGTPLELEGGIASMGLEKLEAPPELDPAAESHDEDPAPDSDATPGIGLDRA